MGKLVVSDKPVAAVERLLTSVKKIGLLELRGILACTFTFDPRYFGLILEKLSECHPQGDDLLARIPIDVVCDRRQYRSHDPHYNVQCWQGTNLFHPKLLMLHFSECLVWIEGSLNLTRHGYETNRELATIHASDDLQLPEGVCELVAALARQGVSAAVSIDKCGRQPLPTRSTNRSLSSLKRPIWGRLVDQLKEGTEVVVVSPFFDARETADSIESSVLRKLKEHFAEARFRIYLPEIRRSTDGKKVLQANRATFTQVFGNKVGIESLAFRGVPSDINPLHAKLIAIRHGNRGSHATLLTGSPNLTAAALLEGRARSNVELARIAKLSWKDVETLLRPLGSTFRSLGNSRFESPPRIVANGWNVLISASYDPFRQQLILRWQRPDAAAATRLRYADKELKVDPSDTETVLTSFFISERTLRLECICKHDELRRSWFPISIPFEAQLSLSDLPSEESPSPDWWLAQIGGLVRTPSSKADSKIKRGVQRLSEPGKFDLGLRVRELAERIEYAHNILSGEVSPRLNGCLQTLRCAFDSHDPDTAGHLEEQVWRLWVRQEILQVVGCSSKARCKALFRELKRRMDRFQSPDVIRMQWQSLAEFHWA